MTISTQISIFTVCLAKLPVSQTVQRHTAYDLGIVRWQRPLNALCPSGRTASDSTDSKWQGYNSCGFTDSADLKIQVFWVWWPVIGQ